jgi:hypothetical protein
MAIRANLIQLREEDSVNISNYNPNKINVGNLINFYTGSNPEDNYCGPSRIGLSRPMEESVSLSSIYPNVIKYSDDIDWVFLADGRAAAVTRVVVLYEYNKKTSNFNWKGYINVTYPIIGNKTIRGQEVVRKLYSTGTVTVSGTTITGVNTLWKDDGQCVGSRIGFGSTDPTQITQWREITDIVNNTELSIDLATTNQNNIPYVIEDLRIVQTHTNATAANGGLFVIKGLRVENFIPTGTNISAATTIDNIRASYWLADSTVVTNTIGYGCAVDYSTDWNDEKVYVINATTAANSRIYVYNHRQNLTDIVAGRTTESFLFSTGTQTTTGNISATNNGIIASPNHGPGIGVKSLYWVTATRVYRSLLTDITADSTSFHSDVMVEIPPGGVSTYILTSTLSNIIYSPYIDRFIIFNTGVAGARSYVTRYNTASSPFDHIFLSDNKQLDQSSADSNSPPFPSINASVFSGYEKDGLLYLIRHSVVATLNQMYSLPIGAHQSFAFDKNELIITPKIDISNSVRLYNIMVNNIKRLGSDTFAIPTEPFRIFFRTGGIDDNTGSWNQLNDASELSSVSGNFIQFAFTFRILGNTCIPARLVNFSLLYEDLSTDSHYIPSVNLSSVINRVFAYRQTSSFSGNIPQLRIRLYNADNNGIVIDDNTTSQAFGTFQYSIDGINWNTWDNTQNTVGNYIRYTAASTPGGIKIRALLTQ